MDPSRRSRDGGALVAAVCCVLLATASAPAASALVVGDARSAATTATTGSGALAATATPASTAATTDAPGEFSVPAVARVPRNGRVRLPVSLGDATDALLVVGGPTFNYEVAARLADGDGSVDVAFRARAAGDPDEETLVAADGDGEVNETGDETALSGAIEPADYAVRLVDDDGDVRAEGTLIVGDARREPGQWDGRERPARPPGGFGVGGDGSAGIGSETPLDALGALAIGVGLAVVALGALVPPGRY